MANQFSTTGTYDRNSVVDLLNKQFDVIWAQRNELAGVTLEKYFYKDMKESGLNHKISSVTSHLPLPQENEDTDALPYAVSAPGFDKDITLVNYRLGVRVTRTMMRADRFGRIMEMAGGLAKAGARLDEYLRASKFNNAFTGNDGADGKDLCDDDHPLENPERGTWDNKGTGALSGPNLQALRLLARKMVDPQGDPDWRMVSDLLVPEDLEQKANELTGFGGVRSKPEGMLNDPNVFLPSFTVVCSPYLSSAVQYYLIDPTASAEEKGLHEVVLDDWSVADNSPANVDIVLDKRIRAVKAFAITTSKAIYGSTGA